MKRTCIILGTILCLLLLVYGTLAYCVFFYYGPRIAREESRQEGWEQAIAEIEEECRHLSDSNRKFRSEQSVQREKRQAKLEKTVRDEEARRALLDREFRGPVSGSGSEWKRRTDERLQRAQQALDDFKKNSSGSSANMRLTELRQQLEALRARQQEFQDLCERRDKLMVWPLPLIAPLFENGTSKEE